MELNPISDHQTSAYYTGLLINPSMHRATAAADAAAMTTILNIDCVQQHQRCCERSATHYVGPARSTGL